MFFKYKFALQDQLQKIIFKMYDLVSAIIQWLEDTPRSYGGSYLISLAKRWLYLWLINDNLQVFSFELTINGWMVATWIKICVQKDQLNCDLTKLCFFPHWISKLWFHGGGNCGFTCWHTWCLQTPSKPLGTLFSSKCWGLFCGDGDDCQDVQDQMIIRLSKPNQCLSINLGELYGNISMLLIRIFKVG